MLSPKPRACSLLPGPGLATLWPQAQPLPGTLKGDAAFTWARFGPPGRPPDQQPHGRLRGGHVWRGRCREGGQPAALPAPGSGSLAQAASPNQAGLQAPAAAAPSQAGSCWEAGPAEPGTGVCRNVLGCSLPGREPGDQGQAKRPAPRSRGPLARHRPDAQMPGHREQRKEFQVSAGRLPGQAKAPPAPLALEHPASLRWPAAATERSQKPFTRQGHQHRGQTISNKRSLPRSLSPRGGVQTEVVGKIRDLGPGLKC